MSTSAPDHDATSQRVGVLRRHALFTAALVLGAALRVLVMVAFRPGFILSDAHTYLILATHLVAHPDRVVGYGAALAAITSLTHDIWVIAGVQHLLGLGTAVLGYALLRRWGVSQLVATLAMLPVLVDAMQLALEHSILSDVLYDLLLLAGVAVLAWRRVPSLGNVLVGGLVLGLSVLVRVGGEPVVLGAVGFCLLTAVPWRRRVVTSLALVAAFVVPLVAYAAWFDSQQGSFALTTSGGRALYMRTTGFVDCSRLQVPAYERRLCPAEPVGHRLDPTQYGWHSPDGTAGLRPPPGVTLDGAFRDFAWRAIRAQPGAYVRIVLRDAALTLWPRRVDRYGYDTADKWQFANWRDYRPTPGATSVYADYGGPYRTNAVAAQILAVYGNVVYLPGPLIGLLVLGSLVGLVWPRRPSGSRPLLFLTLSLGVGLTLVPIVTAEFVWRYMLPSVLLVPMAAACAWTRISARPRPIRTTAPEPLRGPTDRTAA